MEQTNTVFTCPRARREHTWRVLPGSQPTSKQPCGCCSDKRQHQGHAGSAVMQHLWRGSVVLRQLDSLGWRRAGRWACRRPSQR